jgi:hypothetical protein
VNDENKIMVNPTRSTCHYYFGTVTSCSLADCSVISNTLGGMCNHFYFSDSIAAAFKKLMLTDRLGLAASWVQVRDRDES